MIALKPRLMKELNEALVREALYGRGTGTKADFAEDTGLSLTTISQILAAMEKNGEIRRAGLRDSSGGRKAARFELDPGAANVYAVAVEDDRLDWAVANALGTLVADGTRIVRSDPFKEAAALVASLRKDQITPRAERAALAIGIPGAVHDGAILTGKFKGHRTGGDVGGYFRKATGLPVAVENDVNATALGFAKRARTEGRPVHSLVYIHTNGFCTGSGIFYAGRIVRGAARFAGEVGFLPLRPGATFDRLIADAKTDRDYVTLYATSLTAVNCVINPALFVVGGTSFRYDLSDSIAAAFNASVDASVRPMLVFERESRTHYLSGLCGLAVETIFPTNRLETFEESAGA